MTTKRFKIPVRPLIISVYFLCLLLLVGLGSWQLIRGLEKGRVESQVSALNKTVTPLPVSSHDWASLAYAKVEITGSQLPEKTFLLDNKTHKGRLGYEVFKPFVLENSGLALLVNFGWIERGRFHENLISSSNIDTSKLLGQLYFPNKGFTIGPAFTNIRAWPIIIQYLDLPALSDTLGMKLESAVVVKEPDPNGLFTKIWQPYVVSPVRHFGYATQWWGLALVFVVFGFIWKNNSRTEDQI